MTTAHVLANAGNLKGLVFLDTGISIPKAFQHVRCVADRFGWKLEVYRTPISYEWLVKKFGFPSAWSHSITVNYLKGRGVTQFKKAHPGEWLASGVRKHESGRRKLTVKEFGKWEGVTVWAPIYTWTTERVWAYIRDNDLPISPAYKTLHISGECLCGAFARREEGYILRTFYPEVAARIGALEKETGKRWGGWSEGVSAPQSRLESFACSECYLNETPSEGER